MFSAHHQELVGQAVEKGIRLPKTNLQVVVAIVLHIAKGAERKLYLALCERSCIGIGLIASRLHANTRSRSIVRAHLSNFQLLVVIGF